MATTEQQPPLIADRADLHRQIAATERAVEKARTHTKFAHDVFQAARLREQVAELRLTALRNLRDTALHPALREPSGSSAEPPPTTVSNDTMTGDAEWTP